MSTPCRKDNADSSSSTGTLINSVTKSELFDDTINLVAKQFANTN